MDGVSVWVSVEHDTILKSFEKVVQFGVLSSEVNFLVNVFESSHFELLSCSGLFRCAYDSIDTSTEDGGSPVYKEQVNEGWTRHAQKNVKELLETA